MPYTPGDTILKYMGIKLEEVKKELSLLAIGNEEYAKFNARIVNTNKTVLGVRVPALRKYAKLLARDSSFDDIKKYIDTIDSNVFEQTLLAGMLINSSKLPDREKIALAKQYLKFADSWAEIDIFASKRKKFDDKLWWNFASHSLSSPDEFTVRYGVVEMMANFLNNAYIEQVFQALRGTKHDGYYVRMGIAWLYATAAVDYYDCTLEEIQKPHLSLWTKKKALTKMCESYRFSVEQKKAIRALRSNLK